MYDITKAIEILRNARHLIAFCGAGISVESGIPPFRGEGGLWNQYDSNCLDLEAYLNDPEQAWVMIKEIFYDFFGQAKPNPAHYALAELEKNGLLKTIITQNIDNLHQEAGSHNVVEFHGNSHTFVCTACSTKYYLKELTLTSKPPKCPSCRGLLKPDFIFFGEMIPAKAREHAFREAELADAMLVIGTTGEVMPACMIPYIARQQGARIIEINPGYSAYQNRVSHIHICQPAGIALPRITKGLLGE
jgi:NAD-dependent protein deacetylase/lipoamidase